jgi:hypothetical protein
MVIADSCSAAGVSDSVRPAVSQKRGECHSGAGADANERPGTGSAAGERGRRRPIASAGIVWWVIGPMATA